MKKSLCILWTFASLMGCAKALDGVDPPDESLYYPVSLALSPDASKIYVVSSDFDKRYNAGWVSTIDFDALLSDIDAGNMNPRARLGLPLKIPSLSGRLSLSPGGQVGMIPRRGQDFDVSTLITLDFDDAGVPSCGDANATEGLTAEETKTDCDRAHLLRYGPTDFFAPEEFVLSASNSTSPLDREGPAGLKDNQPDTDTEDDTDIDRRFRELFDGFSSVILEPTGIPGALLGAVAYLGGASLESDPNERIGAVGVFDLSQTPARPLKIIDFSAIGIGTLAVHPDGSQRFLLAAGRRLPIAGDTRPSAAVVTIDLISSLENDESTTYFESTSADIGGGEFSDLVVPSGDYAYATVGDIAGDSADVGFDGVVTLQATTKPNQSAEDLSVDAVPSYAPIDGVGLSGLPSGLGVIDDGPTRYIAAASFREDLIYFLRDQDGVLQPDFRLDIPTQGPFSLTVVERAGRQFILVLGFIDHSLSIIEYFAGGPSSARLIARVYNEELPEGLRQR